MTATALPRDTGSDFPADRPMVSVRAVSPGSALSLGERAAADGVRYLLATFTTLTGKPCAKLVPVSAADDLQAEGCGFAGYAAGGLGQVPADPDVVAIPDVSSYTPLTFVRPDLAMVHCDPHVGGAPYPFAPRVILREQIGRAADLGLQLSVGAEVEYFLVKRGADGQLRTADVADDSMQPCYDARGVTRMYDHLTAVSDAMERLGWGPTPATMKTGTGSSSRTSTTPTP